jgi:transcriptional regulator with XRE-family HTH domain
MRQLNPAALREIRQLAGVTQAELARRAGIHPRTMTNIELGKHGVSPQLIVKLAEGLKTPVDAITHLVPDPEAVA